MSVKFTEAELYTLNQSMDYKCLYFEQILTHIEEATNTFLGSESMTGDTADAIKCYFSETHLTLLKMMKSYIKQIKQRKVIYFDALSSIDPALNTVIDTTVLDKCVVDAGTLESGFNSIISKFGSIHRYICNLTAIYDEYTYSGGRIANDLLKSRFDFAYNNIAFLKTLVETIDSQEVTNCVAPLQETRTSIKNLLWELYNSKDDKPLEDYKPGDLKKTEGYEDAKEAYDYSLDYLIRVDGDASEKRFTQDFLDFQAGKLNLAGNVIYSGYNAVKSATSAIKDIGLGIASFVFNPGLGFALVVKGAGEAVDALDNAIGTVQYGVAFFNDDIYYQHESVGDFIDQQITDGLFFGNEDAFKLTETIINCEISSLETYDKTGKLGWSITSAVISEGGKTYVVPVATDGYVELIDEITGLDLEGTVGEKIIGDLLSGGLDKSIDLENQKMASEANNTNGVQNNLSRRLSFDKEVLPQRDDQGDGSQRIPFDKEVLPQRDEQSNGSHRIPFDKEVLPQRDEQSNGSQRILFDKEVLPQREIEGKNPTQSGRRY